MRGVMCFVCVTILSLYSCSCNQYDPHLIPKSGPFFEGWYVRILPCKSRDSFGFLFGNVLPESGSNTTYPKVLTSLLLRNCSRGSCALTSYNSVFDISRLNITVKHGQPVTSDPDDKSPANFQWKVNSSQNYEIFEQRNEHNYFSEGKLNPRPWGPNGAGTESGSIKYSLYEPNAYMGITEASQSYAIFEQRNELTSFKFKFGNISLSGRISHPRPWGPNGEGPEGWFDKIPFLPLHWFVFSLNSSVIDYVIKDDSKGTTRTGNCGYVHQEKNWGNSFPNAWIWSQGFSDNGQALYALTGGPVNLGPMPVTAYLFGYRNPYKNLTINFKPGNGIVSVEHFGCQGYVNISAYGLFFDLNMTIYAPILSFSDCLFGPEVGGFRRACVESYDAEASISVYKRDFLSLKLVDFQKMSSAALEFGGQFVCNSKCS